MFFQSEILPCGGIVFRPRMLHGATDRITTPLGTAFITVNRNGAGEPFEVFINVGKAGSDTASVSEAMGRLISFILRLASSLTPAERLEEIVGQLQCIGRGRSLPDAIARVLADCLEPDEEQSFERNFSFQPPERCRLCSYTDCYMRGEGGKP